MKKINNLFLCLVAVSALMVNTVFAELGGSYECIGLKKNKSYVAEFSLDITDKGFVTAEISPGDESGIPGDLSTLSKGSEAEGIYFISKHLSGSAVFAHFSYSDLYDFYFTLVDNGDKPVKATAITETDGETAAEKFRCAKRQ